MSEWTKEPWSLQRSPQPVDGRYDYAIHANGAYVLAEAFGRAATGAALPAPANAERIVACVNYMAGVTSETIADLAARGITFLDLLNVWENR